MDTALYMETPVVVDHVNLQSADRNHRRLGSRRPRIGPPPRPFRRRRDRARKSRSRRRQNSIVQERRVHF